MVVSNSSFHGILLFLHGNRHGRSAEKKKRPKKIKINFKASEKNRSPTTEKKYTPSTKEQFQKKKHSITMHEFQKSF
jgi:hypothetical protein